MRRRCRPSPGRRPHQEATITTADQARELVLRRGVRRRGRRPGRRPGPRRGGRRRRRSAPAAAPRCASSPRCSTPARSSRSAPAPASPACGCCAACAPTACSPPSTSRPSTSGWPASRSPRPASPPSGRGRSPARRSTCSPGSPTATTTWSSATATRREYAAYLKEALRLLRPGGVVAFDNALWHDRVADPAQRDEETVAIRDLGREVAEHDDLVPVLLPVGDGLLVAKKEWTPEATELAGARVSSAAAARKPSQPSATATTSHSSMRIGALPMICEPGRLRGAGGEGRLERRPGPRRWRRRSSPRTTRPARIRQVLKRSPAMPVNRACEVPATYDASSLLDAVGRVGQRPADGQPLHRRCPPGGRREPSHVQQRAGTEAGRARWSTRSAPSGESPTEAMSRWAHGHVADEVLEEQRRGDRAGAARGVVGVGDARGAACPRRRRRAGTATAARRRPRPASRRAAAARPSWLAKKPPTCWPSATFIAPVSVATSTSDVGVELVDGVRERVGEHQPALGVGVGDLAGAAAVVADHVAGTQRVAADGVLGGGDQADRPAPGSRPRRARPCTAITTAPPVMSRFMLTIASPGLIDRPPVSKVMPLPTSTTVRRLAAGLRRACSRAGSAAAGVAEAWPTASDAAEALGRRAAARPRRVTSSAALAGQLARPARPARRGS